MKDADKAVIVLSLVFGLLPLSGFFINTAGVDTKKTVTAQVISKKYTPAHWVGKMHVSEAYEIFVTLENKVTAGQVDKFTYDMIEPGDNVSVDYGYGRITSCPVVTAVHLMPERDAR